MSEYEVIGKCPKCGKITPHKLIIFYDWNDDICYRYELYICENCGYEDMHVVIEEERKEEVLKLEEDYV